MKAKLFLTVFFLCIFQITGRCYQTVISSVNNSKPEETDVFIGQSFRIFPDTVTQIETIIATHPLNPLIMAASAVTDIYPGGYTTGVYVTSNGGLNWTGTNSIRTQQSSIIITVGNPSIVIDKNGTLILTYIAPSLFPNGRDGKVGVSYSTNNGLYWSPTVYVPGVDSADKPSSTTDNVPSSPYFGRSYIVYSELKGIYFSYTSNGGVNWSNAKRICPPLYNSRVGANIQVGLAGEIYVTWPYVPEVNDYIGFAKSTDGGLTWDSSDYAIPVTPTPFDFRVNINLVKLNGLPVMAVDKSGGERNGWIYIASSEKKANGSPAMDNCDIIIHCSTNRGISWPLTYRVNQSDSTVLRYQLFPAIAIDKYGGVNLSYYDTRNSSANDSFQVYLSHSDNGGVNFRDDLISGHKFKLKQLSIDKRLFGVPSYIGTAAGITCNDNKVWSFWFDNYFQDEYQGWLAGVDIAEQLTLKVIPQGLFNTSTLKLNSKDTVKITLYNSASPYVVIDSATGIIDSTTFTTKLNFRNTDPGIYFISVSQRNSFDTWSKYPVSFNTAQVNYDFTSSASQAYADNQILIGNKWCIYSGDINKDGMIDVADLMLIQNDALNFVSGHPPTDVNGDFMVDVEDLTITYGNLINFVSEAIP